MGWDVTTAENAHGALELLGLADGQQNFGNTVSKVNLIITDYSMPGMTGYELLKKIKESPTGKLIPVVVVSSEHIPTRIENWETPVMKGWFAWEDNLHYKRQDKDLYKKRITKANSNIPIET
ncbi:two-component response regulator ARR17 [Prunus yedoensis var. nudiflora]|uniref:Two-component response regulator ARR17 n=1 Tax=Prunus yedoensis var. nudiflora TaxID=2094558 RepID=A0A314Y475_PRUYE|nr:two-component response regulator ARR17 [Prunus yedoensis var. nudiflora]